MNKRIATCDRHTGDTIIRPPERARARACLRKLRTIKVYAMRRDQLASTNQRRAGKHHYTSLGASIVIAECSPAAIGPRHYCCYIACPLSFLSPTTHTHKYESPRTPRPLTAGIACSDRKICRLAATINGHRRAACHSGQHWFQGSYRHGFHEHGWPLNY